MAARQATTASNSTPIITTEIAMATTLVSVLLVIALVDSLGVLVGVTSMLFIDSMRVAGVAIDVTVNSAMKNF